MVAPTTTLVAVLGGGSGITPLGLFSRYGADGIYIPTFNPAVTAMWQESGQTTVCDESGEPIGYVTDVSGTGTSLTQTNDIRRPTLVDDGGSGSNLWSAETAGLDHIITDFKATATTTALVACRFNAATDRVLGANDGSSNNWRIGTDGSGQLQTVLGTGANVVSEAGDIRGVNGVAILVGYGSTYNAFWKPFGDSIVDNTAIPISGSAPDVVQFIGANNNNGSASLGLDGDVLGVYFIKASLSFDEIEAVAVSLEATAGV